MARKKKHPEHANHERWLVSYADLLTLLFAFFVVMFAVSNADSNKVGKFSQAFTTALDWSVMSHGGGGVMPVPSPPAASPKPAGSGSGVMGPKGTSYEEHKEAIRKALANRSRVTPELQGLNILEVHGELVLRLPERLMFDVGGAQLRPEGQAALGAIASELAARSIRVRIEGHTDSIPVKNAKYASNWDLSTARATSVVAHLLTSTKIDPVRLAAAGYAEFHPVASNDTPDGRAQNRRVDIIVVAELIDPAPPQGVPITPAPAGSGSEPKKVEDPPKFGAIDLKKPEHASAHASDLHKEPKP